MEYKRKESVKGKKEGRKRKKTTWKKYKKRKEKGKERNDGRKTKKKMIRK